MQQVDSSIYLQQQAPRIFGSMADGIEEGLKMKDLARMRKAGETAEKVKGLKSQAYVRDPVTGLMKFAPSEEVAKGFQDASAGDELAGLQQQEAQRIAAEKKAIHDQHVKHAEEAAPIILSMQDPTTYAAGIQRLQALGNPMGKELGPEFDPAKMKVLHGQVTPVAQHFARRKEDGEMQAKGFKRSQDGNSWEKVAGGSADLADQKTRAEIAKSGAERQKILADAVSPNKGLTEGEQAVDKKYAENYNNFTSKGRVNALASIKRLEDIASELEADNGWFQDGGGRASSFPDGMRSRNSIRWRDGARNAANSSLKELFPGALSDGERAAAANEYYNDALDNKENAKIIREKLAQLKAGVQTETAKAKFYEKNRTLKGFKLGSDGYDDIDDAELVRLFNQRIKGSNADAK